MPRSKKQKDMPYETIAGRMPYIIKRLRYILLVIIMWFEIIITDS
jgi:hypothetical protein